MKKTAHYRRVVWLSEEPDTLSSVLEECFNQVPDRTLPSFKTEGGLDCVIAKRTITQQPHFLHFVVYESGAPAAVIAAAAGADELDADTASPPDGHEYIQHQLFCVVNGNHVVWSTHNNPLRERGITALFYSLVESLLGHGERTKFDFQAKLDRRAFKQAFDRGITEIDLGIGEFRPTLETLNNDSAVPWLRSLITRRLTPEQIEAASNVFGKVVLTPKKKWKKPEVKELLSEIASNVLEGHHDEFVIQTASGMKLTRTKMSVHWPFDVSGDKRVLHPTDARVKLSGILKDWDDEGLLE